MTVPGNHSFMTTGFLYSSPMLGFVLDCVSLSIRIIIPIKYFLFSYRVNNAIILLFLAAIAKLHCCSFLSVINMHEGKHIEITKIFLMISEDNFFKLSVNIIVQESF